MARGGIEPPTRGFSGLSTEVTHSVEYESRSLREAFLKWYYPELFEAPFAPVTPPVRNTVKDGDSHAIATEK
jgi:hypothetical protein